jgi:radical SAM protein with 4Fe4S-binding SPASM domain
MKNIPINKGNYSLDTPAREELFNKNRAFGVEEEYYKNRKEWEDFPNKFFVAEYPLLVDVELSTICNLRCPFCYRRTNDFQQKVKQTLMDFGLFTKIVDEIGSKVYAVRLSLRGEPTLHPQFIEAISYAKSKGIREVSFLTNGSKLTPDYFLKIIKAGADWITISFDGIYDEYEKNRKPLKFAEMFERLTKIKEIRAKNKSVKPVIKLQTVWPAIANNPSEFYNKMTDVCDLLAFNPLIDYSGSHGSIEYIDNFSCPQHYQRLVVGANGLIMMCSNDEENDVILGDAYKHSIFEIWHCEKLNKIRKQHKKRHGFKDIPVCRKCYLPRKTKDIAIEVNRRSVIVKNY